MIIEVNDNDDCVDVKYEWATDDEEEEEQQEQERVFNLIHVLEWLTICRSVE